MACDFSAVRDCIESPSAGDGFARLAFAAKLTYKC
jgi:hypothetical protein